LPPSGQPSPQPGLELKKLERVGPTGQFTGGPEQAAVGQTIFYKLIARNTGNTTLKVAVSDSRCDSATLAPTGLVTLSSGGTAVFTCSHVLMPADGPSFVNTANAVGRSVTAQAVTATANASVRVGVVAAPSKVRISRVTKNAKPTRARVKSASFTG
jgi:hypothetical protein